MAEKTEQPTPKKLRDAARKGQSFKSRDATAAVVLAAGACIAAWTLDLGRIAAVFARAALDGGAAVDPAHYLRGAILLLLQATLPFTLCCAAAGALASLLQSRFTPAFEALRIDWSTLSPARGLKRLWSVRTVKEVIKALLYLAVTAAALRLFVALRQQEIFALLRMPPAALATPWHDLTTQLIWLLLVCALPVLGFDAGIEYFAHRKDQRMDRHELRQESKEQEGNPDVKMKRRDAHLELLSAADKASVEQSNFVIANPTHVAIGIYLNEDIVPLPLVSVREANARALAVIRHAERSGVPVVRNVPLARALYRSSRRYAFVGVGELEAVLHVVAWLRDVEAAYRTSGTGGDAAAAADDAPPRDG